MKPLRYEKPVLIDLKKNDAMIGLGAKCQLGSVPSGSSCFKGNNREV